jgi:hypothetical protein
MWNRNLGTEQVENPDSKCEPKEKDSRLDKDVKSVSIKYVHDYYRL